MSQDFGIDNEGQGFDFDEGDETDLDKLLDIASQGAEEEDDDDSVLFFNKENKKEDSRQEPQNTQQGELKEDESSTNDSLSDYSDDYESEVQSEEDHNRVEEISPDPVANEPEEITPVNYETEYQPDPVAEEPKFEPEPTPAPAPPQQETYENKSNIRRVTIKSEAEEVSEINKVIKVLDTYRKLNNDVRNVVSQFVDNDDMSDESTLVVKVLRADPMLSQTMAALRDSASQNDRVERVFYILRLETKLLYNLGTLVETLTEEDIENKEDKIGYSKNVEKAINDLDKKVIDYVSATQSVLSAAEENEE